MEFFLRKKKNGFDSEETLLYALTEWILIQKDPNLNYQTFFNGINHLKLNSTFFTHWLVSNPAISQELDPKTLRSIFSRKASSR
jgi:hypothetical protein